MTLQCDRCGKSVQQNQARQLFGLDLCMDCFTAVEKFAHTKINQSTTKKVLHGLAVVGKKIAENQSSSGSGMKILDDKPDPQAKKWIE